MGNPDVLVAQAIQLIESARIRADVVPVYAHLIREIGPSTEHWGMVNRAIIARWSTSALPWIKTRAWDSLASARTNQPESKP